jgi:hypothetical protein
VLAVLRGERLLTLNLTPQQTQTETWSFNESARITAAQEQLRSSWLGIERR